MKPVSEGTAAKKGKKKCVINTKKRNSSVIKWVETIKTLINDTPGSEEGSTILNNDSECLLPLVYSKLLTPN